MLLGKEGLHCTSHLRVLDYAAASQGLILVYHGIAPGIGTSVWGYFGGGNFCQIMVGHDAVGLVDYLDDRKLEGLRVLWPNSLVDFVGDPPQSDQRTTI